MASQGSALSSELEAAVTAAIELHPQAFSDANAVVEEAVSRLIEQLAAERPGAYKARGTDFDSVRTLIDRWLESRSRGEAAPANKVHRELAVGGASPPTDAPASPDSGRAEADSAPDIALGRLELTDTALRAPPPGVILEANGPEFELEPGPLFGLHNRDYPTLWAASALYARAAEHPVELRRFVDEITEDAWNFASSLAELESRVGRSKLRALFPSNPDRMQSSAEGFRTFAIGSIHALRGGSGRKRLAGPFYQWRLARVQSDPKGDVVIGRTLEGENLLDDLAGISLETPHSEAYARTFLEHLMRYATGDWEVFQAVLSLCATKPNRTRLVAGLRERFEERAWTEPAASSYAVGYVGRSREWGLLKDQLTRTRTYELTSLGAEFAEN